MKSPRVDSPPLGAKSFLPGDIDRLHQDEVAETVPHFLRSSRPIKGAWRGLWDDCGDVQGANEYWRRSSCQEYLLDGGLSSSEQSHIENLEEAIHILKTYVTKPLALRINWGKDVLLLV